MGKHTEEQTLSLKDSFMCVKKLKVQRDALLDALVSKDQTVEHLERVVKEYQERLTKALRLLDAESQAEAECNFHQLIRKAGEVMRERCFELCKKSSGGFPVKTNDLWQQGYNSANLCDLDKITKCASVIIGDLKT